MLSATLLASTAGASAGPLTADETATPGSALTDREAAAAQVGAAGGPLPGDAAGQPDGDGASRKLAPHAALGATKRGPSPRTDGGSGPPVLTFEAESSLSSRFMWRGLALSRGPVLQVDADASIGGFQASIFGNALLTNEDNRDRLTTLVPEISYATRVGRVAVEVGSTLYLSAGEVPGEGTFSTVEADTGGSVDWGPVEIVATGHVDLKAARGALFGTVGVQSERELGPWTLTVSSELGAASARFNDFYFDQDVTAIDFLQVGVIARHEIDNLFFTALHAEASQLLSSTLRSSNEQFLVNAGFALGLEM